MGAGGPLCGPGGERGSPLSPHWPVHPCKARPRKGDLRTWSSWARGRWRRGPRGDSGSGGLPGWGGRLGGGWYQDLKSPPGDLEGAGPEPVAAGRERRAGRGLPGAGPPPQPLLRAPSPPPGCARHCGCRAGSRTGGGDAQTLTSGAGILGSREGWPERSRQGSGEGSSGGPCADTDFVKLGVRDSKREAGRAQVVRRGCRRRLRACLPASYSTQAPSPQSPPLAHPPQAAHLPPPQPSSSGHPVCPASWLMFTILCSPRGPVQPLGSSRWPDRGLSRSGEAPGAPVPGLKVALSRVATLIWLKRLKRPVHPQGS